MSDRPTILSFVKDPPNIVTLLGLSSGVLGIYFALLENFQAAVIAMLWAVLFDWYDGPVARRIAGRSDAHKSVGSKMDSLVDIVSLAICPAILLLSYGEFSAWFFPGALLIVMAGVVRLAYFDVFGVDDDGTITGLTSSTQLRYSLSCYHVDNIDNRQALKMSSAVSFTHRA